MHRYFFFFLVHISLFFPLASVSTFTFIYLFLGRYLFFITLFSAPSSHFFFFFFRRLNCQCIVIFFSFVFTYIYIFLVWFQHFFISVWLNFLINFFVFLIYILLFLWRPITNISFFFFRSCLFILPIFGFNTHLCLFSFPDAFYFFYCLFSTNFFAFLAFSSTSECDVIIFFAHIYIFFF